MKGEIICNDETITRKKKKKSQKQSKDVLVDKLSNTEAGSEFEHVEKAISHVPESSKKKKHKRKHEDVDEECNIETDGKRKSKGKHSHDNVHKKQKTVDNKPTTQSSCDTSPDNEKIKRKEEKAALTQASCENDEPRKKKKKSKGKSVASDIVQDNQGAPLEEVETVFGDGKHKKRKKKHNVDLHLDNDVETKDVAKHKNLSNTCVEESTNHHKKKKKHSKHKDTLSKDESESKVRKNKHKNYTIDNTEKNESGHGSEKHKASKKHKLEKHLGTSVETQDKINIADQQILSSTCEEDVTYRKKNKKHKHKEVSLIDQSEHSLKDKTQNKATCGSDNISAVVTKVHSDKKRSVPKCVVAENEASHVSSKQNNSNYCEDESVQHHKEHKKHSKTKDSPETNHLTVSKSSSSDQTHSMKAKSESQSSVAVQGQWQGNLFESSERQNKFLRLLGGMKKPSSGSTEVAKKEANGHAGSTKKKGLFGSLTSMVSTLSPHNAAMSLTAAASLNQKLEDEYNKAMNFKLGGKVGTGFGFAPDPAEGKKFHIDINKSKSVKFDD